MRVRVLFLVLGVALIPPSPTGATLADGTPLPSGCGGQAVASETVGFVADGRAWALDPHDGHLACLFRVRRPGSFAFGPAFGTKTMLTGSWNPLAKTSTAKCS